MQADLPAFQFGEVLKRFGRHMFEGNGYLILCVAVVGLGWLAVEWLFRAVRSNQETSTPYGRVPVLDIDNSRSDALSDEVFEHLYSSDSPWREDNQRPEWMDDDEDIGGWDDDPGWGDDEPDEESDE